MSLNPVVAEISRSALRHNLEVVRRYAPSSKVLAMIKANGYGHDAIEVATILSSGDATADAFGVARINEAISLRESGIKTDIVLMEGCFNTKELECASEQNFQVVLHNRQQLEQILTTDLKHPVSVWLKIDTGMGRVGFEPDEIAEVFATLNEHKNIHGDIICMTHFACADYLDSIKTEQQLQNFIKTVQELNCKSSCANSASIVTNTPSHFDWVRPGIMLYGSSPVHGVTYEKYSLKPAMSLQSIVISVRAIKAGDSVGYGARWVAAKDTKVAVVAMGYGDGYPRNAKDGTPVMINGQIYPLAGKVSMDMITVDIGAESQINMGDPVILWGTDSISGNTLPAETVASHADTISYEMFCNLAARVEKRYVD